ncbi:filamentous hemagglutinin N-terminal domain-containing protein [Salmonella enterica subsp. enterica serovar Sandiego]|nr:filamentous hemagglutinin N-terminal domain-containing protein [Salmonella enterica subsp. enterica serovar Sandiego]EFS0316769.1 filamentous hemagglutinin N-terminal domain-containing protein [Salmonella enterica subsp. enterica serovar Sandiego]
MNHIYRVIWNAATASWQAVPENTRSHTKTKSICRAVCGSLSAMAIMISVMPQLWAAEPSVSVASGNTSAYVSRNGTTIVNINAANAAGLSHNLYNRYDVNPQGLVLNNTTPDKATWATQLAGQINANFNMKKSAQVILNEVVSANRSRLAGFTEVAGGKADVVVANPYGITCSGCGFINTDRVTLTTGKPYLSSIGALEGFRVTQGDILIQGNGMNATAQQMLDLVTRSVKLDGDINARQLAITTGTNNYDYAGRKVTGTLRGTDSTPVYAVDSTALGGMYAGRIQLTATEAGVGVRMLGDAAASAEDFVLSSAGNIELQNRLSATRDIRIAGNSPGAKSLVLADASLTSGRDTRLQAAGDTTLNGGAVVATGDLALSTAALTDNSTDSARQNDNVRRAGGALTLTTKDNAGISGTRWSSAGRWQGTFAGLTVSPGAMLTSSGTLNVSTLRGDMTMNSAVLQSRGNLQLDSAGQIRLGKKSTGHQDIQSTHGDLILHGNHGVHNEGDISADKGSISLLTDQTFTNSGTVHAGSRFTVSGLHNAVADVMDNSGRLLSGGALKVRATSLANTASGLIQADNHSDIRAHSLNNQGTWLLSNQDGAADRITLTGALTNGGTLQSRGDSTLSADTITSSGTLLAAGSLTLGTGSFTASGNAITQAADRLALTTTGKTDLQAGTLLGGSLDLNAGAGFSNAGRVVADKGDIGLKTAGLLDNSGLLQAAGDLDIADMQSGGSENLRNSGKILAGGKMTVKADDIVSQPGSDADSGWIQAGTGSEIEAATLDNQGTWLLSNQDGAADRITLTGALTNGGTLQSRGDSTLSADTITSSGMLLAAGNLKLSATGDITSNDNGVLQANKQLTVTTTGDVYNNGSNSVLKAATIDINAAGLTNHGKISADTGSAGLHIDNTLSNDGQISAGDMLTVSNRTGGTAVMLSNGGKMLADRLNIITEDLRNAGIIQGGESKNNNISVQKTVVNDAPGIITISATGGAGEMAVARLTNNGKIQSAGNFNIRLNDNGKGAEIDNAGSIVTSAGAGLAIIPAAHSTTSLNISGSMQSGGALTVNGNNTVLALKKSSSVIADTLTLTLNKISVALNSLLASAGDMTVNTGVLDIPLATPDGTENTARIMAATSGRGTGKITTGSTFTNTGLVYSGNDLELTAPHIDNSSTGGIITVHDLTVRANAGTSDLSVAARNDGSTGNLHNEAEGNIYAGHNMSLDVNGILTNDGSIHTDNSLVIKANTVTNKFDITSNSDVNISAYRIENLANNFNIKTKFLDKKENVQTWDGGEYEYFGCPNHDKSKQCGKRFDFNVKVLNADYQSDKYSGWGFDYFKNTYKSWDRYEVVDGEMPQYHEPQIMANNKLIMVFVHGVNNNGVIYGNDVEFNSQPFVKNEKSDFINKNNVLRIMHEKETTPYYYWYSSEFGDSGKKVATDIDRNVKKKPKNIITYSDYTNLTNSGIYAKSLTITGMALTNNGVQTTSSNDLRRGDTVSLSPDVPQHPDTHYQSGNASVNLTDGDNVTGGTLVTVTDGNMITGAGEVTGQSFLSVNAENSVNGTAFGGINIPLPANPNGLFVPVKEPGAHYLVESNPLFTGINVPPPSEIYQAGGNVIHGSDYLAEKLGYTPDQLGLRLGDASYENYLVKQQVIAQTGNVLLKSYNNANQQMQAFLDNSVAESKSMGLQLGMALSKEQQNHLDKDIVWMVQTEVAGKTVLTPVVYLSQATRDSIMNGSVLSADETNLQLTSLNNNGGTINGSKSLNVAAEGDIKNNAGAIKGGDVNLTSTEGSITNDEGGIAADNKLGMQAKKDIHNLSGQVQGGDVSLTSTEGSIVNETRHSEFGGHTTTGPVSTITSTGNLAMDAGQDIKNLGADVKAGENAGLKAAGNVTFDTIEDKNTTSTGSDTTTTVKQLRSGLTVGKNLDTTAGNDITFAGTDVGVAGNAHLDAGNNLEITDRQDSTTTHTESEYGDSLYHEKHAQDSTKTTSNGSNFEVGGNAEMAAKNDITVRGSDVGINGDASLQAGSVKILDGQNTEHSTSVDEESGIGVNDSLYGTSKTTTRHVAEKSVASYLKIRGSAQVKAKDDFTLQGSDVDIKKDADINAKTVNILAGRNTDKTDVTTEKTAILQASASGSGSAEKALSAEAGTEVKKYSASADASASAGGTAEGQGEANLIFASTTTTHEGSSELKHTASHLNTGGNGKIHADTVNLKDSEVSSGDDMDVKARNINLQAAEDKKTSYKDTSTTRVGLMADSDNKATGKAEAGANAGAKTALKASASANVSGSVESSNNIDLVQTDSSAHSTLDTTHQGSAIKSGGKMKLDAGESLTLESSALDSGKDMDLHARDMKFKAAEDRHEERDSSNHVSAGFYADGSASAGADTGADVNAGLTKREAGVSAGYNASAEGEVGIQTRVGSESNVSGSTTAVTSSIHSGGNIKRKTENSITDVGTQINTEGDFEQSASKITSEAARNTSYKSHSDSSDTTRLGIYGEASAQGSASADSGGKTEVTHKEEVGSGVAVSHQHDDNASASDSSEAVVSNVHVKGNFRSTSTQGTTLEGTNITAGKNAELNAGMLDYRAAKNTSSESENSNKAGGKLKAGESGFLLSGEYEKNSKKNSRSDAVVGGINVGGDLKINTSGDTHLEGTRLSAEGAASLTSGGNVSFDAAKNTGSTGDSSATVKAGLSAEPGEMGMNGSVDTGHNSESYDTDVAGSISSGSGPLTIKSGGDVSMTGTYLDSKKAISVEAAGDLSLNAAHDRKSESSSAFGTGVDMSAGESKKVGGNVKIDHQSEKNGTFTGVNLDSGGDIRLHSGRNTTLEGTGGSAAGKIDVSAGGHVTQKETVDTSSKSYTGVALGATYKKEHAEKQNRQPAGKGTSDETGLQATRPGTEPDKSGEIKSNESVTKQPSEHPRSATAAPKKNHSLTEKTATETPKTEVKKEKASPPVKMDKHEAHHKSDSSRTKHGVHLNGGNGVTVTSGS